MAMFTVDVTPDDGSPFRVEVASRDAAQWEKRHKGANWSEYENAPNIQDSYRMAFIAAVRQGLWDGTLDAMEKTCDLKFVSGSEEPDPTPSAA